MTKILSSIPFVRQLIDDLRRTQDQNVELNEQIESLRSELLECRDQLVKEQSKNIELLHKFTDALGRKALGRPIFSEDSVPEEPAEPQTSYYVKRISARDRMKQQFLERAATLMEINE